MSVDLPDPLPPSKPWICPGETVKPTSSSARVGPNLFDRCSTVSAATSRRSPLTWALMSRPVPHLLVRGPVVERAVRVLARSGQVVRLVDEQRLAALIRERLLAGEHAVQHIEDRERRPIGGAGVGLIGQPVADVLQVALATVAAASYVELVPGALDRRLEASGKPS